MKKEKQNKIKQKWKKSVIKISKELRNIIHGYIMSDGYVTKNGICYIEQSKKQEKFVLWLYKKLELIKSTSGIKQYIRIHPKTKNKSYSLRFFTKSILDGFHNMWYLPYIDQKGFTRYKKKLPNNIHCFFDETFISIWYAGDGTKIIGSKGAKFEVTSFSVEERLTLKNLFFSKFNIKALIIKSGISKKGNIQWALKIPASEYLKFRDLITQIDLIPTIFPYKLHKK
jgi:NADH:ubiquinone oxidoreductase subunit 5 (subunit L)/multisubunit Na+/H+ antiporter MnhA subunit